MIFKLLSLYLTIGLFISNASFANSGTSSKNSIVKSPFNLEKAMQITANMDAGWNSHDPEKVALVYTEGVVMDTMGKILSGRDDLIKYATQLFEDRQNYHVKTKVFLYNNNKISTSFDAEWMDKDGDWNHSLGMQNITCDNNGHIKHRYTVFSSKKIKELERMFK